ncbi:hypothetical protein ACFU6I_25865 [Streptomyces sp. NPDC057486]|uniref:hypothetical protein n=1 Tax=Streptomyces sp. NPDC057486 TaxID=3346145 RepID=UPI00369A31A6
MLGHRGKARTGAGRSSGNGSFDETSWWWVPIGVVVGLAVSWGIAGLIEGGCRRGPRGGCVAADGYELHGWVLFLASMPAMAVVIIGLAAGYWPPTLGLAGGGAAGGLYALGQGQTESYVISAGVFFALAIAAPTVTLCRRLKGIR